MVADLQQLFPEKPQGRDLREKTDPVRVRENPNFLTLERITKCPKECVYSAVSNIGDRRSMEE